MSKKLSKAQIKLLKQIDAGKWIFLPVGVARDARRQKLITMGMLISVPVHPLDPYCGYFKDALSDAGRAALAEGGGS
jgi:hypothetical protein